MNFNVDECECKATMEKHFVVGALLKGFFH